MIMDNILSKIIIFKQSKRSSCRCAFNESNVENVWANGDIAPCSLDLGTILR